MLNTFDWLRRSENGAELIAAMDAVEKDTDLVHEETKIGQPVHGINGPCIRCWIYPRVSDSFHCRICNTIVTESRKLGRVSRKCLLVWGYVNYIPDNVKKNNDLKENKALSMFIKDEKHFLVVVNGYDMTEWFRRIILDCGSDLKGLLTVFPTTGKKDTFSMGDILCRAVHYDSRFPMDRLRIRFFSRPGQLKVPHMREKQGMLTFEPSEFLGMLEMATFFQSRLRPEEQKIIKEITAIKEHHEKAFYWGRLMSNLSIEARDMLSEWNFREWSENKIKLLYDFTANVPFTP
jgi:hypothetical protein